MERFLIRKNGDKDKNCEEAGTRIETVACSSRVSKGYKRKYLDDYLKYGFIASENDPSLPFCLLCSKTLSNECMNPSKLLRHLETSHPESSKLAVSFFENLKSSFQNQSKRLKKYFKVSDKAQIASFQIAQLIAKKKKPHAEAEEIIAPALKIAAECMLRNDAVESFKNIPLSSKTIARRIQDMSVDIESQLKENFNCPSRKWSIQLDETTDISKKAQLLAFLRFAKDGKIQNHYFFCQELKQTTTGKDIFDLVDENVKKNNLRWENCVSVCTDGASAMLGHKKGFAAKVLEENQSIKIVHCMIHREVLVSKSLPANLKKVLDEVVKVVNFIKANALRSRIFTALCEAMESEYKTLLFHTEVRWLSKGKVLNRFVTMKVEIISFIDTEEVDFPFLKEDLWWLKVSFLSDLFEKLNECNLQLQGSQENFITISSKLKGFEEKMRMWTAKIKKSNFFSFPSVDSNPSKIQIQKEIETTLITLTESFLKYFPNLEPEKMEWVVNPFMEYSSELIAEEFEENLIDLRSDLISRRVFGEKDLSEFWISLESKFPLLSSKAVELLLPFGSSYLCELGFSALTEIKSKKRERLQMIDQEMRVCLSTIEPRINLICEKKQSQVSH